MKTKTEMMTEYVFLSWNYEFPHAIELALQNDFAEHPSLYNRDALRRVSALLLLSADASPENALAAIRDTSGQNLLQGVDCVL